MASPFRVFRKHQKVMLAVLGLLAMIAFVFLPIVMDRLGTRPVANSVVVTTTEFGEINTNQLSNMISRRQVLLGFLQRVQMEVQQAGGQGSEAATLARRIGEATEESVVNTWLLAEEAKRLGLAVDDAAINSVLNGILEQRLTGEQLERILYDFRLTQGALFEAFQTELLALRLEEMFGISLAGVTPAQQWDYHKRLNRKASIETVAIPVDRFTEQVPDPGDAVLREFFEKYKDRLPEPGSPKPGLQIPKKIKVEYAKADYEKFLETVDISNEEIRQYYEENKESYKREEPPSIEPEAKEQPQLEGPEATAPERPAEEALEKLEKTEDATGDPQEGTGEPGKSNHVEKASATQPKGAGGKDRDEAEEDTGGAAKPDEKPIEEKAAADQSSATRLTSPFKLVSYQDDDPPAEHSDPKTPESKPVEGQADQKPEIVVEEAQPRSEKEPEETTPAMSSAKKERKPAEAKETVAAGPDNAPAKAESQDQPEDSAPATPPAAKKDQEPAAAKQAADAEPGEAPATAKSESKEPAPPMPPAAKEKEPAEAEKAEPEGAPAKAKPEASGADAEAVSEPEYLPLEEVRDEIRRQLKRQRAREKIQELLQELQEKLTAYYNQWIVYDATRQESERVAEAPVRPDFAKLTEGTPLTARQTSLISAFEASELDIGDSWIGSAPFTEHAYGSSLLQFKPAISQDNEGNSYLFWKTEETEERVPEFEDPGIRQEVLHTWKMIEARSLAVKEAEKLADEVRKSEKSFEEFFAGEEMTVTEAGPFTWLNYGDLPPMYRFQRPPTLSSVEGVDTAGPAFMRTVFQLDAGEIGVATNRPKTDVYLIHAVEFNPPPDVLWTTFLQDPYSRVMAATQDRLAMRDDWLEEIKESVGFQWERQPVRTRQRAF